jgi:hypothetical protein
MAALHKDKCLPLMDNGHYHPTEVVSDKIPALLCFFPEIALHITRGVRWDSDHVLLLDDEVPRGQVFNTHASPYAKIIDYKSTPSHAHMVLNMTPQYGAPCKSAKRALALTENRNAVILRDEMEFHRPTTAVWVATPETEDITFSENGRVAYLAKSLEDGAKKILRASLLSEDENLRFSLIPKYETLIGNIITKKNSGNERASDAPLRLAIRGEKVEKMKISVVFEMVSAPCKETSLSEKNISEWRKNVNKY